MKTFATILLLLAFCRLGPAQTKADNQLSPKVRLYQPKNLNINRVGQVARFVQSVIGGSCVVEWSEVPHAIVIRSQNPSDLDAAEALLIRFDVPEPPEPAAAARAPMDCTIYLLRASSSQSAPPSGPTAAEPPTSPVPAELQPAIEEMKHTFGYDRYTLWDAIVIQGGNDGELQGILPTDLHSSPYVYSVIYRRAFTGANREFYLNGFQFSVKMPPNFEVMKDAVESRIKTDVTIHEGQKLVLGKIRLLPTANADLFLVLATRLH
jgi:hypothetical protein